MNKIIISFLVILLIPFFSVYGSENTKITGQNEDSVITIEFSDKKLISYSLEFTDSSKQKIELGDSSKFKIRDDNRFYILDRENGIFVIGKNIEDKKWIVLSKIKIDSEWITKRWIVDIEPIKQITGQRDLLGENNKITILDTTENSFKESQHLKKLNKIEEAKKIYDEKIQRLESENSRLSQTETKVDYEKYEEYKKSIFNRDSDNPKPEIKTKTKDVGSLQLFLSVPKHIEWKQRLNFDVLVTDESKHKYDSSYNAFVGNGIKDTIINFKIINPDKITIHESDGNTDSSGYHKDSFLIPDNSKYNHAYTLEVIATKSINDIILKEKSKAKFFVNPISKSSFNDPPIAVLETKEKIRTANQTELIIGEFKKEFTITKYNSTHYNFEEIITGFNSNSLTHNQTAYLFDKEDMENDKVKVKKDTENNYYSFFVPQNKSIELDASKSSDPDDTVLVYLWKLINPQNNEEYKSLLTGIKPSISVNATDTEIFEFELIVSDKRKQSIPVYEKVTVYNGTIYDENYKKID